MTSTANPRLPIGQLGPGQTVNQVFLISQPQLRATSRGDHYIAAFLSDATGKINGRMWQASEMIYQSLPDEGFVRVRGRTEMYQNSLQLVIEGIAPVPMDEVDLTEFLPATPYDIDVMFQEVLAILREVKDPGLLALLKAFVTDEPLMAAFRRAPAAITMHHAYIGGLLEHTLSMLKAGAALLGLYPQLNADLVLTGLFLHDIGKTSELSFDISFRYSTEGRMIGHLVKGAMLIEQKLTEQKIALDDTMRNCLLNILVSHHGVPEYGCAKRPAFPEAYFIHYLDNLDAKMAPDFCRNRKGCRQQRMDQLYQGPGIARVQGAARPPEPEGIK